VIDNTDPLVERLRDRLRALELDAGMNRARQEEVRDLLAQAEGRRRPRRVLEVAPLPLPTPGDDAA
jgi:hypothetical protein